MYLPHLEGSGHSCVVDRHACILKKCDNFNVVSTSVAYHTSMFSRVLTCSIWFIYSVQILKILLNPPIEQKRICCSKPCNVSRSSTLLDLESLWHLDDIKKNDFGKWIYGDSHSVAYAAFKSGGKLEFERQSEIPSSCSDNVFQLCCINCKLPEDFQCQRLLMGE